MRYRHDWIRKLLLFAGTGVVGTGMHYIVLVAWVQSFGNAVWGTMFGFVAGAVVNYFLNYHVTFASTQPHLSTVSKFMVIAASGFVFNAAIVKAGITWGFHYLVSQVLATVVVFCWTFMVNLLWTFRSRGCHAH